MPPPSVFYSLGAGAGRNAASAAVKAVCAARGSAELGRLAGKALEAHRAASPDFYSSHANFALGFWEAFVGRAEDLRSP